MLYKPQEENKGGFPEGCVVTLTGRIKNKEDVLTVMASRLTHPKGNFSANYSTGESLLFTSNKMDAPMLASKTGQSSLWVRTQSLFRKSDKVIQDRYAHDN